MRTPIAECQIPKDRRRVRVVRPRRMKCSLTAAEAAQIFTALKWKPVIPNQEAVA